MSDPSRSRCVSDRVAAVVWHPQPSPEDHAQLGPLRRQVGGPCVIVDCPPEIRTQTRLAHALLRGMGKRLELTGASRDSREAWRRVHAWVTGERFELLVINRADV